MKVKSKKYLENIGNIKWLNVCQKLPKEKVIEDIVINIWEETGKADIRLGIRIACVKVQM